jgi:hypothetical protein
MNNLRSIVSLSAAVLSLIVPRVVLAQATTAPAAATTTAPVVTLHGDGTAAQPDLKGVPPDVAKLIVNFNALRDKYLLKQHILLESLQNATTDEQRDTIREQLQDNRQAFLDELSDFRIQLKDELKGLQGRISNAEFLRIIDTAQGSGGNIHHRGH